MFNSVLLRYEMMGTRREMIIGYKLKINRSSFFTRDAFTRITMHHVKDAVTEDARQI